MTIMITNHQIVLHPEGGKRRVVKAGVAFNFTDEQIAEITAIDSNALREPLNESETGAPRAAREAPMQAPRAREPKAPAKPARGGNALTGAGSKATPAKDDDDDL